MTQTVMSFLRSEDFTAGGEIPFRCHRKELRPNVAGGEGFKYPSITSTGKQLLFTSHKEIIRLGCCRKEKCCHIKWGKKSKLIYFDITVW